MARPKAGSGEVVVRVRAAGVNGLDCKVRDGLLQGVFPLALPITLGIELAGEVIEVADDVTAFAIGDRVMGPLGGLGAFADEVAVAAHKLAKTPAALDWHAGWPQASSGPRFPRLLNSGLQPAPSSATRSAMAEARR